MLRTCKRLAWGRPRRPRHPAAGRPGVSQGELRALFDACGPGPGGGAGRRRDRDAVQAGFRRRDWVLRRPPGSSPRPASRPARALRGGDARSPRGGAGGRSEFVGSRVYLAGLAGVASAACAAAGSGEEPPDVVANQGRHEHIRLAGEHRTLAGTAGHIRIPRGAGEVVLDLSGVEPTTNYNESPLHEDHGEEQVVDSYSERHVHVHTSSAGSCDPLLLFGGGTGTWVVAPGSPTTRKERRRDPYSADE